MLSSWTGEPGNFLCVFPWAELSRIGEVLPISFVENYKFNLSEII
jgi:hypothetical protein